MARLGRRQPFPPKLPGLIAYQTAAQTAPVVTRPIVASFAANCNRRPISFGPKLPGLITYQTAAQTAPVVTRPFIASFAANNNHRPVPFGRVLSGQMMKYSPVVAGPPIYAKLIFFQIAVQERERRGRALIRPITVIPPAPQPAPRVRGILKVGHEESVTDSQGRRHGQDVSTLINALARAGELGGTVRDPHLAYLPSNPTTWGTTDRIPLSVALDRISAALAALGVKP